MLKRTVSIMLFLLLVVVSTASARVVKGVKLPETLTFDNVTLGLNGAGTRMEFIIQAYVAGLYLQEPMTDPEKIINADEPMAIRMHVTTRMATSKRMQKALYKGFRGTMPRGNITPIKDKVEKFNSFFSKKVVSGQELDVVYIPNKGTSVYRDGVLMGTVPGYEFKKHVFGIWLGNRPASKKLKKNMVAGDFRVDISRITIAKAQAAAKAKAEKLAGMKAAQEAKAQEAKAQEAKAQEVARQARAEEAARMNAAAQEKARLAAEAEKARAKAAAIARAEETARMNAAAQEKARLAAEAEKRAAQAKALQAKAEKAAPAMIATSVTAARFVDEDILFGFNSAKLSAKAEKILERKIEWLKAHPDKKVAIQVFCDPSGSRLYNEYLAGKRAKSVIKVLTDAGISKDRIETLSFKFAKSRRAHFTIK